MSSATAWAALQDALKSSVPSCEDDPRFTGDSAEDDDALRTICNSCPVQQQCAAYAKTEHRHRVWGFYGGVIRRTKPQVRHRRSR